MWVQFGKVETRDYPARDGRAARTGRTQLASLQDPKANDGMGVNIPFKVNLRDDQEPYTPGRRYELTGDHFKKGDFDALDFDRYGKFRPQDEAEAPKLSDLARARTA